MPCPAAAPKALGERGKPFVDDADQAGAVKRGVALATVDLVGDFVKAPFEFTEKQVALFDGVALPALDQSRQHFETLFDARKNLIGVGNRRRAVDLVGDRRDLVSQPLDRLVGQGIACRKFVDPT